jgi:ABC-type Fe3+ transport system substrate-binding protein
MDNKYFSLKDTLFDITEKYEESIDLLVSIGVDNIKDNTQRRIIGKIVTLEAALKSKGVNAEVFVQKLIEKIEESGKYGAGNNMEGKETVFVSGVLPCPVRIPMMEAFEDWLKENQEDLKANISYDLRAASMGVDWLKEKLVTDMVEEIPDLFISAGFDLFFDKKNFGKFKERGVFEDITGREKYNNDFENEYISLKDPEGEYSLIGAVPAIFLVNTTELEGQKIPETWEELLSGDYDRRVSLPVGDFDLFNAILLNINKKFGEEGIRKLKKTMLKSMHPAEMVKSHVKKYNKPAVTIMPYFFTKLIKENSPMKAIWPKDGAIISPIFMITKKNKKELLKPLADFFVSKQVGEILAHNGRFPSVNYEVDNRIPEENKYIWLGWDYIKKNNIGELISYCESVFKEEI